MSLSCLARIFQSCCLPKEDSCCGPTCEPCCHCCVSTPDEKFQIADNYMKSGNPEYRVIVLADQFFAEAADAGHPGAMNEVAKKLYRDGLYDIRALLPSDSELKNMWSDNIKASTERIQGVAAEVKKKAEYKALKDRFDPQITQALTYLDRASKMGNEEATGNLQWMRKNGLTSIDSMFPYQVNNTIEGVKASMAHWSQICEEKAKKEQFDIDHPEVVAMRKLRKATEANTDAVNDLRREVAELDE